MAADRQRLAQALAAEAARRKMFESIPEAAGQGLPQAPERPMGWNDYLENLSIGLGRGAVNNLEGVKSAITSPIETAKGFATGVVEAVRNPRMIAEALKQTGQRAMSGPLGLGEVIGENVNMMRVPGKPVMHELDVYHGSPHRFPATEANPLGEFDASKIGTGEGAQAYGHGIYYAQNPDVARPYAMMNQAPSRDSLIRLRDQAPQGSTEWKHYDKLAKEKVGSFYKADLPDEMIDQMLDYDKPLNEQPLVINALKEVANRDRTGTEAVAARTARAILQKAAQAADSFGASKVTGAALHDAFLKDEIPNLKERAEFLKNLGIPGIKYLDIGSKGQPGTGTRNFVVFPGEEKKVRILERNGQPAPERIAQALEAAPNYRMAHRPMTVEGGAARLDNAYEAFGEDIYGPNALRYFGGSDPREAGTVAALKRLRDNPEAEVTIYRGVPADAKGGITKGDWVTLDRSAAQEYAELKPGQKGKVLAMKVKAKDVTTWPDSLLEFGYYPAE